MAVTIPRSSGCKIPDLPRRVSELPSNEAVSSNLVRFGGEFELDLGACELRRAGRPLRLARIPMELLLLLVEQRRTTGYARADG